MLHAQSKKEYAGRAHQAVFLLISAMVLSLSMPVRVAQADAGPKPSMDFEFVYETEEPLSIVDGKQMQCRVWVWVGRLVGPAFAIPLGLLILMGGLLYLLDAWGRE
jgi:hypothetical protein